MKGTQNNCLYLGGKDQECRALPLDSVVRRSLPSVRKGNCLDLCGGLLTSYSSDQTTHFLSWTSWTHRICYPVRFLRVDGSRTYLSRSDQNLEYFLTPRAQCLKKLVTPVNADLGVHRRPGVASPLRKGMVPSLSSSPALNFLQTSDVSS